MIYIKPYIFVPTYDYWLYVDEFNQLWKLSRTNDPSIPFTISLVEKDYNPK
jgi:hypothetical protein